MRVLLALVLLVPLSGCELITSKIFEAYLEPGAPSAPDGVIAYRDQVYAKRGERELLLDVYAPEERGEASIPTTTTAATEPTSDASWSVYAWVGWLVIVSFGLGWHLRRRDLCSP